jgi:hypothetical protein
MSIEFIILAVLTLLLAGTLFRGIKCVLSAFIGIADFILALFIPIGKCKCGEKTICVTHDNGKYSLVCQNYSCRKRTSWHKSLISAKKDWSEIRGKDVDDNNIL